MLYRTCEDLHIVEVENVQDRVSVCDVKDKIACSPFETVYVTCHNKLVGIISYGDLVRCKDDVIEPNTNFTKIMGGNYIAAKKIFEEKESINCIPVINEEGILVGDYKRWDGVKKLKRLSDNEICEMMEGAKYIYDNMYKDRFYLVKPSIAVKLKIYNYYKELWDRQGGCYRECEIDKLDTLPDDVYMLFVDEEELKGAQKKYGSINGTSYGYWIGRNEDNKSIKGVLGELVNKGVNCCVFHHTPVKGAFFDKLSLSCKLKQTKADGHRISAYIAKDFFGELYSEEYYEDIDGMRFDMRSENGVNMLKDVEGKYLNVRNGERLTVNQPKEYEHTIKMIGPCVIIGTYVEDKYTIASYLQKEINAAGLPYRVNNCGGITGTRIDIKRLMHEKYDCGDIVFIYSPEGKVEGLDSINMFEIAQKCDIHMNWVTGSLMHCNNKVNECYAKSMLEMVKKYAKTSKCAQGIDVQLDRSEYIKNSYIKRYFEDFEPEQYKKVGSIVMNCNPFTYGHRYLIETAKSMVDYLIIFVVEEDRSTFAFEDRFEMVCEGTKDLANVKVVPSGDFILSQTTFPEYFVKIADEDIEKNVEYDITLFADHIASQLNIKYRFVGEEKEDAVTNEYNNAMKRILPTRGIELIEISRKSGEDELISASRVRKYMEAGNLEQAYKMVPESTRRVIG